MASYRVCFFNDIPRNGRLFRCCQRSIVVPSAETPEQAVEAAKKLFVRLEGIRDWRFHAACIEVALMDERPVNAALRLSRASDTPTKPLRRQTRYRDADAVFAAGEKRRSPT